MCVVSMIYDHYQKTWPLPPSSPLDDWLKTTEGRKEHEDLKKRVQDLEELLKKAKIYDEENNQPDCESESKKEALKKLAEVWGIEIDFPSDDVELAKEDAKNLFENMYKGF